MNMRKQSLVLAMAFAAICVTAQDFKTDFKTPAGPELKIIRKANIENGVLKLSNGGTVDLNVSTEQPFKIQLKARVVQMDEGSKNPPFWQIVLNGKDKARSLNMFRADGLLVSYFYNNDVRDPQKGFIKKYPYAKNEFGDVELSVNKGMTTLSVNGTKIGQTSCDGLLPLKSISLGTYNLESELDSISFSILPAENAPQPSGEPEEKK